MPKPTPPIEPQRPTSSSMIDPNTGITDRNRFREAWKIYKEEKEDFHRELQEYFKQLEEYRKAPRIHHSSVVEIRIFGFCYDRKSYRWELAPSFKIFSIEKTHLGLLEF